MVESTKPLKLEDILDVSELAKCFYTILCQQYKMGEFDESQLRPAVLT